MNKKNSSSSIHSNVTYCANHRCKASSKAAKLLKKHGYKKVYDYSGGILEWSTYLPKMTVSGDMIKMHKGHQHKHNCTMKLKSCCTKDGSCKKSKSGCAIKKGCGSGMKKSSCSSKKDCSEMKPEKKYCCGVCGGK